MFVKGVHFPGIKISFQERTLLFDTGFGFRYNCALAMAPSESCEFFLAICPVLMYITPLVLA